MSLLLTLLNSSETWMHYGCLLGCANTCHSLDHLVLVPNIQALVQLTGRTQGQIQLILKIYSVLSANHVLYE